MDETTLQEKKVAFFGGWYLSTHSSSISSSWKIGQDTSYHAHSPLNISVIKEHLHDKLQLKNLWEINIQEILTIIG